MTGERRFLGKSQRHIKQALGDGEGRGEMQEFMMAISILFFMTVAFFSGHHQGYKSGQEDVLSGKAKYHLVNREVWEEIK